MKVLVTSSTGITGRAVVSHLAKHGVSVRAMIHSDSKASDMLALGADETITASIECNEDLHRAMDGIDAVFYICPTAHPQEGEIGCMAVDIAAELGIRNFVYQSVHNSIEPGLIHHRQKLMVERKLLESNLRYTILRPAAFMQNILPNLKDIVENHKFSQRFYQNVEASNRINLIDAEDYGEIAAKVTLDSSNDYAQFDLCGPQNLSAKDMLDIFKEAVGHEIELRYIADKDFISMAESRGMSQYSIEVLLAMFHSYNSYGFPGNPYESTSLLGRSPHDFKTFVFKYLG